MLLKFLLGTFLALPVLVGAAYSQAGASPGEEGPTSGPTIGKAGEGSYAVQLGFYNHADGAGDGNPFLDEDLTVIEPILIYDYNVTDRLSLGAELAYDNVSSASIERLSKFPEQSGASQDNYLGVDLSLNYQKTKDWTLGTHAGYSVEYDYRSTGLGFNATQNLPNANAKLSYSFDAYLDTIDVIRFNGHGEGSESRTSLNGTVNWYQVLSPTSHGNFGVTLASQTGFLETAYNAVVVEDGSMPGNTNLDNLANGFEVTEELPDSRFRAAFFGRVRNSINRKSAYELGGRLYGDSWGISSVAFEPRYYRSLIEGKLDWRLRYRFYTQTEADDFGEHFTTAFASDEDYRTQDSDLAAFDAHTLGTKWTWTLGAGSSWDFNLDYTLRSDGLDQFFGSVGWRHSY